MKLRDQCEHGRWDRHPWRLVNNKAQPVALPSKMLKTDRWCPGGAEVEINYEAALKEMRNRRIDRYISDPDIMLEACTSIVDAALGIGENE